MARTSTVAVGGCVVCGATYPDPHDEDVHRAHRTYLRDRTLASVAQDVAIERDELPENEQRALWGDR